MPFDPSNFDRCVLPAAASAWNVGTGATWMVDTDTNTITRSGGVTSLATSVLVDQAGGPQLRIFVASGVNVAPGGTIVFTGARPAVLVSYSDITVGGIVSASAEGSRSGAGRRAAGPSMRRRRRTLPVRCGSEAMPGRN